MKNICESIIIENTQLTKDYWKLKLEAPTIAKNAKPGQFIEIYFNNSVKIFPRPFSIAGIDKNNLILIYKIVGSQTKKMTSWKTGEQHRILGPLGNFFQINNIGTNVLVGGGVGTAPMIFLRSHLISKGLEPKYFSGARNDLEYFPEEVKNSQLFISTDDGSKGFKGNVVQHLEKEIQNFKQPINIYSCGPKKMMEALKKLGQKYKIKVQLSMETLMACGMGLCQGCAIKTYSKNGEDKISLVCKDGPIFKAEEINFHG